MISIHALREEGDRQRGSSSDGAHYFYPRPPRGGRLCNAWSHGVAIGISIHALREEGDFLSMSQHNIGRIFLSTPSARRATCSCSWGRRPRAISIHALREEGDMASVALIVRHMGFLSTPSARRATVGFKSPPSHQSHFYPRPPRGGRLAGKVIRHIPANFYPRPPRGGRPTRAHTRTRPADFYPRPPRGGRPAWYSWKKHSSTISIHALREEGDCRRLAHHEPHRISIHALREEGDTSPYGWMPIEKSNFYPRPPRGGRPVL